MIDCILCILRGILPEKFPYCNILSKAVKGNLGEFSDTAYCIGNAGWVLEGFLAFPFVVACFSYRGSSWFAALLSAQCIDPSCPAEQPVELQSPLSPDWQ